MPQTINNTHQKKPKVFVIIWAIVTLVLLAGFIISSLGYFSVKEKLNETKELVQKQQINKNVLKFLDSFVKKVLKAEGEVSFEDRLELENSVRVLNNEDILNQWQKFVDSGTEEQAQKEVKNLLEILVENISY